MQISALLTSLPCDFAAALQQASALGFEIVDIVAVAERDPRDREALADSGLVVSCAALGRNLPDDCSLDHPERLARQRALDHVKRQITDAAQLGATHGYIVPPKDDSPDGLLYFGEACDVLGEFAHGRMLQICIEHFPGRVLPTAAATLGWLDEHPQLALLVDLGHCLISREDPAAVVALAGSRLGYVHLDDNDGINDVHWPLLAGCLTRQTLHTFLLALRQHSYASPMALELNSKNADPVAALAESRRIVLEAW